MNLLDQAHERIKLAAFDLGVSELARRAKVSGSTARRLIKDRVGPYADYVSLYFAAEAHHAEQSTKATV